MMPDPAQGWSFTCPRCLTHEGCEAADWCDGCQAFLCDSCWCECLLSNGLTHTRSPHCAPIASRHTVDFYTDDTRLSDSVAGFLADGLQRGESAIVIATPGHRRDVRSQLVAQGIDLAAAEREDRYIPIDATATLARFMVAGSPDGRRFAQTMRATIARASGSSGRPVRAFGEMVALLWAHGNKSSTLRLEQLWNGLARQVPLALHCAYPRVAFGRKDERAMRELGAEHSGGLEPA